MAEQGTHNAKVAGSTPAVPTMTLASEIASNPPLKWKRRPQVLLCANIVKPLHGLAPRAILGKKWWDDTRHAAFRSTDFHCVACGVHRTRAEERQYLEGHEIYSVDYRRGRQTYVETVGLCHYCHNFIHDGRLAILASTGEVSEEKYRTILLHGTRVLGEARLVKHHLIPTKIAPWAEWRLVLFGKEYPPIHRTYEDWFAVYGHEMGSKEH